MCVRARSSTSSFSRSRAWCTQYASSPSWTSAWKRRTFAGPTVDRSPGEERVGARRARLQFRRGRSRQTAHTLLWDRPDDLEKGGSGIPQPPHPHHVHRRKPRPVAPEDAAAECAHQHRAILTDSRGTASPDLLSWRTSRTGLWGQRQPRRPTTSGLSAHDSRPSSQQTTPSPAARSSTAAVPGVGCWRSWPGQLTGSSLGRAPVATVRQGPSRPDPRPQPNN